MSLLKKTITAAALLCASLTANAEFVRTDVYADNDQKATLHVETGIEWMDSSETSGMSINGALAAYGNQGWRLPTQAEVFELFTVSFGDNVSAIEGKYSTDETTRDEEKAFRNNMGYSYKYESGNYGGWVYLNYFYYIADNGFVGQAAVKANTDKGQYRASIEAGINTTIRNVDYRSKYRSVALVSDGGVTLSSINDPSINENNANSPANVSAPASVALLSLAIAGFGFRRKVRK